MYGKVDALIFSYTPRVGDLPTLWEVTYLPLSSGGGDLFIPQWMISYLHRYLPLPQYHIR